MWISCENVIGVGVISDMAISRSSIVSLPLVRLISLISLLLDLYVHLLLAVLRIRGRSLLNAKNKDNDSHLFHLQSLC